MRPGNIDLYKQPRVKNTDGSYSTVDSASFNITGEEVLLPSVTPDGRHLKTDDEIVAEYKKTGRHLGTFRTPAAATAYAQQLHDDYAKGKYNMATPRKTAPYVTTRDKLDADQARAIEAMKRINADATLRAREISASNPTSPTVSGPIAGVPVNTGDNTRGLLNEFVRPRPVFPQEAVREAFAQRREEVRPTPVEAPEFENQQQIDDAMDEEWYNSTDPEIVKQRESGANPPGLQRAINASESPAAVKRRRDATSARDLAYQEEANVQNERRFQRTDTGAPYLGRDSRKPVTG